MGCCMSNPRNVLLLGNDQHSGQTTFLNRLAFGMVNTTIVTVGFNVETIMYDPVVLKPDFTAAEFIQEVEKRNSIVMNGMYLVLFHSP